LRRVQRTDRRSHQVAGKISGASPRALDKEAAQSRIADLKLLLSLSGQSGVEVRKLYAAVYGSLAERKYDLTLSGLHKAVELAPEFALTKWKGWVALRGHG